MSKGIWASICLGAAFLISVHGCPSLDSCNHEKYVDVDEALLESDSAYEYALYISNQLHNYNINQIKNISFGSSNIEINRNDEPAIALEKTALQEAISKCAYENNQAISAKNRGDAAGVKEHSDNVKDAANKIQEETSELKKHNINL